MSTLHVLLEIRSGYINKPMLQCILFDIIKPSGRTQKDFFFFSVIRCETTGQNLKGIFIRRVSWLTGSVKKGLAHLYFI